MEEFMMGLSLGSKREQIVMVCPKCKKAFLTNGKPQNCEKCGTNLYLLYKRKITMSQWKQLTVEEQNKYISDVAKAVDNTAEIRKEIEEHNKNSKPIPKKVVLIWIAAMAITGIIGLFEIGSERLIAASWLTYIILFFIPVTTFLIIPKIKEIKGRKNEDERFEKGEMTQAERESYIKRKLKFAEQAYHHGDITLTQLEALKKKYTGESFYLDNFGISGTTALDNKVQAELAIERHNKAAERNMIINAAIGDAVGGTTGAIIGAATSAQKSAQEAVVLEKQRAAADQNFKQAFDNACKNKFG